MGQLAKDWGQVSYEYTSIDPAFMNLLQEAAAKIGMEVGPFVVDTLRERATSILNEALRAEPEQGSWEAQRESDLECENEESMNRMLREHAAILASLRRGSRQGRGQLPEG